MSRRSSCRRCGATLDKAARFCGSCGTSVGSAAVSLVEVEGVESTHGWEVTSTVDAGDGRPVRPRRWLMVAGGGVAAALIALALTGGGDPDGAEDPAAEDTSGAPQPSTTVDEPVWPPTSRPPPTTTIVPEPSLVDGAGNPIAAPVLGEPTGLTMVVGGAGALAFVDLDSSAITVVDIPGRVDLLTHIGSDVFALSFNGEPWTRVTADGMAPVIYPGDENGTETGLDTTDQFGVGPGPAGALWLIPFSYDSSAVPLAHLVPTESGEILDSIEIPTGSYPVAVSGDSVIVAAPGGIYALRSATEPRRLSPGSVINGFSGQEFTSRWLVVMECDPRLTCETVVLDAAGGDRHPVTDAFPRVASAYVTVAPDGRHAVVQDWSAGSSDVVNLETGATTALPFVGPLGIGAVSWSGDGRWVLGIMFSDGPALVVFDTATGATHRIHIADFRTETSPALLVPTADVADIVAAAGVPGELSPAVDG